jgi:hypothetical protein
LVAVHGGRLRSAPAPPLVVDLGYGESPVTAVELADRLREVREDVEVVGLEIDPERVAAAQSARAAGPVVPRGGFELAGLRPLVVRALNVLRQYEQDGARGVGHAPGGAGTRRAAGGGHVRRDRPAGRWVAPGRGRPAHPHPRRPPADARPSLRAGERLPKALIHHNVPGQPVHDLLAALDDAWDRTAAYAVYGPRSRWSAACAALSWPQTGPLRHREGELTVPWETVAPR